MTLLLTPDDPVTVTGDTWVNGQGVTMIAVEDYDAAKGVPWEPSPVGTTAIDRTPIKVQGSGRGSAGSTDLASFVATSTGTFAVIMRGSAYHTGSSPTRWSGHFGIWDKPNGGGEEKFKDYISLNNPGDDGSGKRFVVGPVLGSVELVRDQTYFFRYESNTGGLSALDEWDLLLIPMTLTLGGSDFVIEPARDLLMDRTGATLDNESIGFLGGLTRAEIIQKYERVEFWIADLKQTGNNQRNDWPITSLPVEALEPNAAGDGIVRIVENNIQDVYILESGLQTTGLTFRAAGNDGAYVLKMWGVRKQAVALPEATVEEGSNANGSWQDVGSIRTMRGQRNFGDANDVVFPVPFADTSYQFVTTPDRSHPWHIISHGVKVTDRVTVGIINTNTNGPESTPTVFDWIAIGTKP